MKIHELKYASTNTYLIEGDSGMLLFDTGWAGTFPMFLRAMGELNIPVQKISYILTSHFHPDHMGIAEEIAELGPKIVVMDVQREFIHAADPVFARTPSVGFVPIRDEGVRFISLEESAAFLAEMGLKGRILHTPGHSDDSISLWLEEGMLFVGDLNPLYELELHRGTEIGASWESLLSLKPKTVYYGHAKTADLREEKGKNRQESDSDLYRLVEQIMKYVDKGMPLEKIRKKTGADRIFIEDVTRMYLTHQNVGVQGILDRIEIKNR